MNWYHYITNISIVLFFVVGFLHRRTHSQHKTHTKSTEKKENAFQTRIPIFTWKSQSTCRLQTFQQSFGLYTLSDYYYYSCCSLLQCSWWILSFTCVKLFICVYWMAGSGLFGWLVEGKSRRIDFIINLWAMQRYYRLHLFYEKRQQKQQQQQSTIREFYLLGWCRFVRRRASQRESIVCVSREQFIFCECIWIK